MSPRNISSLFSSVYGSLSGDSRAPEVVPPRFLTRTQDGGGFESLSRDRFQTHRSPPANAFQGCQKPSLVQGWRDTFRMFGEWVSGTGPVARIFDTCSLQSQNMSNAWDVNRAREAIYRKNEGIPLDKWAPLTNFKGGFGPLELAAAGVDPTEQFVGSYRVDVFPSPDKTLRFFLSNNTSRESFFYGIGTDYERSDRKYGGNMRQLYTWSEPIIASDTGSD